MSIFHKRIFKNLEKNKLIKKKKDNSLFSSHDLEIQKKLIAEINKRYPEVRQFLAEENFIMTSFNNFDFQKPIAIIDSIDGTENYLSNNSLYGSTLSILNIKKDLNSLFIPSEEILINDDNIKKISKRPRNHNQLVLISTKCLDTITKNDHNIRVLGSASYMFYQFITGKCREFAYCKGAKIWDCYTGLKLCSKIDCKIKIQNNTISNWLKKPTYLTSFILKWL